MFKENIILTDRNRAFSLLLHSVTVKANAISGYSHQFDSLMSFNLGNKDFNVLQAKLKLRKLPRYLERCNTCHEGNGTITGLIH